MRVYLACTVRGDRAGLSAARAIADRLQRHGHEVVNTHLLADDADAAESQLTEEEVYRRDIERLSTCDVLVAEASGSSYGVGFEVGYILGRARHTGQQIIILYDVERRNLVSRMITGNCDAVCCTTFGYRSIEEATAFIDRHFAVSPT